MTSIDLRGKNGIVFGVANQRSIAWAIAQSLAGAGMRLALTYQNERLREGVSQLAATLEGSLAIECDVTSEDALSQVYKQVTQEFGCLSTVVHSLAFAQREDLGGSFVATERQGFNLALEISAYSLIQVARYAMPLFVKSGGGNICTLTFQASERVFPGYNVMGTAKAALENIVKQLASELGPQNVRVNAISAGPLDTLAARSIPRFRDMKKAYLERAPLRRNVEHKEVANTALYLSSDLASGVTGAVIPVDAGYHIMGM